MTIEELQAKRSKILTDMGGFLELIHGDKTIRNRPQTDLEAALQRVDAEIAALQSPQPRNFVIQTNRGLS
jgi:5-enolpyruvylshikimate-3-phosphate synthase